MHLGDHTVNNGLMGTAIRPFENSARTIAEPRGYFTKDLLEQVKQSNNQHDNLEDN